MATTIIALVISSGVKLYKDLSHYHENYSNEMLAQASMLARVNTPALQFDDSDSANEYLSYSDDRDYIQAVAIYNERGGLFAHYTRSDISKDSLPALPDSEGIKVEGDAILVFKRIVANDEILGTIYLQADYKLFDKLLLNLSFTLIGAILAVFIAFLLSLWLQDTVTNPILKVAGLARKVMQERDYSLRATKVSDDEVGGLVEAFNSMLAEIEKSSKKLLDANRKMSQEVKERKLAEKALRESESKVLRLNVELEKRVKDRTLQLETINKELESFSYSVSHDLRTPLRAIDGFSQALLEDYQDSFDEMGADYLDRIRLAAQRMGILIDDMLNLSRVSRTSFKFENVNLSELVEELFTELQEDNPERDADIQITSDLSATCDRQMMRIALHNLLHNAWKYSSKKDKTHIEFGLRQKEGKAAFFVQDNGAGFDMAYAGKLFGAFQRLHSSDDYPGTGVGLATVKRIVSRHGGDIWAESKVGEGTVFYFTVSGDSSASNPVDNLGSDFNEQQSNIVS
ncbi:ATP-binding protein [Dasania sp. GY-MA-18]|uniref:histidine kinase n=1 Tax=Dasania phycosphaerae TaxID=2950436 RepID=A0A9J6RR78_9GAMM|nr:MULTISPECIES: ATP-binding protein [Dasania]MCR8924205.1 ATP-binding protein [Dasania sp. GY-MA-18]MCZ0866858.1 ATP-binding protein [Dasania phycosphaerae]MCZ0870363.1 ATP-binding protein [Dasania phycosphaerae]